MAYDIVLCLPYRTSLHLAASQGHAQTVQLLLDRGADKLLSSGEEQNRYNNSPSVAYTARELSVGV